MESDRTTKGVKDTMTRLITTCGAIMLAFGTVAATADPQPVESQKALAFDSLVCGSAPSDTGSVDGRFCAWAYSMVRSFSSALSGLILFVK